MYRSSRLRNHPSVAPFADLLTNNRESLITCKQTGDLRALPAPPGAQAYPSGPFGHLDKSWTAMLDATANFPMVPGLIIW